RHLEQKASWHDVHVLRPAAEKMRRIFRAQEIAVVERLIAAVVREVVAAVIALAAGNVGSNDHTVAHMNGQAFEVLVLAIATDSGDSADIFVALNDRKLNLPVTVLGDKPLEGVFVCAADAGQFHANENAAGGRFGQRKLPQFVPAGFCQSSGQNGITRHGSGPRLNSGCSWAEGFLPTRRSHEG